LLIIFLISYIKVTFSDPGSPTKDVVNVLSGNELSSFYTTLEELPEYKKMAESSSEALNQPSGALLRNENINNINNNASSSTLDNNKHNKEFSNDISLNNLSSTSSETLSKISENNPLLQQKEIVINMESLINESQNMGNTVFNRGAKKDQISIDVDSDKILERNIEQLNTNNFNEENNDNGINTTDNNDENVNNLVCKKCLGFKPERTHHCSICKRCILKMDHHCPWISNCVGFYNYKYFMLFLFYGSLFILFQLITMLITFIFTVKLSRDFVEDLVFIPNNKKIWVAHIFVSFVLGSAIAFLFISHIYQNLLRNATTLELFDQQRKIRQYRFNIIRERKRKEIEKLENEVKELEQVINESVDENENDEKRKELANKSSKLDLILMKSSTKSKDLITFI